MRAVLLTLLIFTSLFVVAAGQATDSTVTTAVTEQSVVQLGNRVIDNLEKFADNVSISAEAAFPYAVKYVGAQRALKVYIYTALDSFLFMAMTISFLITGLRYKFDADRDMAALWIVISVISTILFIIFAGVALQHYYEYRLFQHALL